MIGYQLGYGGFHKRGYPQIIHFTGIFHYKLTIQEVSCIGDMGVSIKEWGYPQMDVFLRENLTKVDDLGVPLF